MLLWCRQLLAIAQNALAETLRSPGFCLALIAALLLAGLFPVLDYLAFLEKARLVADSLLALCLMTGLFAAAHAATATVGDELRRRTALLVLSKPVSKGTFLGGKLLGLAGALLLFWAALAIAILWGSRVVGDDSHPEAFASRIYFVCLAVALLLGGGVNYVSGRSFPMVASLTLPVVLTLGFVALGFVGLGGHGSGGWALVDFRLLPAIVLCWPAMLLIAAVALSAACWLEAAPTLLLTFGIFALGLIADYLVGRFASGSLLARVAYALLPNFQPFWVADQLAAGAAVPWSQVGGALAYGLLATGGLVTITTAVFESRQLG